MTRKRPWRCPVCGRLYETVMASFACRDRHLAAAMRRDQKIARRPAPRQRVVVWFDREILARLRREVRARGIPRLRKVLLSEVVQEIVLEYLRVLAAAAAGKKEG